MLGLDYVIQYRKGKENVVVDALSRREETGSSQAILAIVLDWVKEISASYEKLDWLHHSWLCSLQVNRATHSWQEY